MPFTRASSSVPYRLYVAAIAIMLCTVGAAMAIFGFADHQFKRSVSDWQSRLNLIADSRAADVQRWVQQQFGDLAAVANNASLQLYVTELEQMPIENGGFPLVSAQQTYLRNLLTLTAERSGYAVENNARQIPANVSISGTGGIAILDLHGDVIASTPSMPPIEGELAKFVAEAPKGQHALYDLRKTADGVLQMGFLVPVYAIQGDAVPSAQVGMVLGVKPLDNGFLTLLKHPGTTEKTLRSELVRQNGIMLEFISPILQNQPLLSYRIQHAPGQWAESYAIENPGQFDIRMDATQNRVLFTSRAIDGTPWTLVEKVGYEEALAPAIASRNQLMTILFISLFAVIAAIAAAWRHGTSRNAIRLSQALSSTVKEGKLREAVLKLVTNTQPGAILLVDEQNHVHYANAEVAKLSGFDDKELIGKSLASVFGKSKAAPYIAHNAQALEQNHPISWTDRDTGEDGSEHIFRHHHIPVEDVAFDVQPVAGVLIVEEDITPIVQERERRERTLRQLTNNLVNTVDQRDPNAADHSLKVAHLARAVAEEMRLPAQLAETAETAGKLMNLGKLNVSSEILTRSGKLNTSEIQSIQDSLQASATMLEEVEFDGPVVDTLRQAAEHYDGSGPNGLKGQDILVTARIIAVANAFIGMTSKRAYRKAMTIDAALDALMKQIDKEFDRKVVVALASYIENHDGRSKALAV